MKVNDDISVLSPKGKFSHLHVSHFNLPMAFDTTDSSFLDALFSFYFQNTRFSLCSSWLVVLLKPLFGGFFSFIWTYLNSLGFCLWYSFLSMLCFLEVASILMILITSLSWQIPSLFLYHKLLLNSKKSQLPTPHFKLDVHNFSHTQHIKNQNSKYFLPLHTDHLLSTANHPYIWQVLWNHNCVLYSSVTPYPVH